MRVLWFSNTPANADEFFNSELKGTGGWLKSLDKALQDRVDLHVAFYYTRNISSFKYKHTHYYPIYVNNKSVIRNFIRLRYSTIVFEDDIKKYLEIIETVKPDLIHIHGTENPFGYIIDKISIPVVISIQGIVSSIYYKYVAGYYYLNFSISKGLLRKVAGIKPFTLGIKKFSKMAIREKYVLSKCNYVFGRTEWDKRVTRLIAPKSKYFHSDEILRDGFYTNKWEKKRGNNLIIFTTLGNAPYKGLETIIHTIRVLLAITSIRFEWRIAGLNVSDIIVKAIKPKVYTSEIKQIKFLGKLEESALISNLLDADIYVNASHIENSPNSLSEAMLLGMPCIATNVGGTSSLLQDGKEGILIQEGEPYSMAGAIAELYLDTFKAKEYGSSAMTKATKRHDKNEIISNLVFNYEYILNDFFLERKD